MARADDTELIDRFEEFYRSYYRNEIGELAQKYPSEQKSLYVDWGDLYRFDPNLADDFRNKPEQLREYAEEALRLYDLPVDVSLGQAHVRVKGLSERTGIREIRADHRGMLIAVQGIVRKATDVRPKITVAAFECQRCGTLTRIPQEGGDFQEPHECQGCERQGPFRINYDQSEFIDAQKLRVQEGLTVEIEDEQFEEMDITDEDKKEIIELSSEPDIYEKMERSIAPSIYGYEREKRAMIFQLFSGVTKHLPDGSRTRGDLHMLLIGDPGTGKSAMLQYAKEIAPRSVYTSGKGSSAAGLTAAAVRDDFGDGQQWTLEAGALVLADQGIAAVDELDKMRPEDQSAMHEALEQQSYHPDTEVLLSDGRRVDIGEFVDDKMETRPEDVVDGIDCEILPVDDVGVHTVDLESNRTEKTAVDRVSRHEAPSEFVRVEFSNGREVVVTPEHPMFVESDGEVDTVEAREIEEGAFVPAPRALPNSAQPVELTDEPHVGKEKDVTLPETVSPELGEILGFLVAEGHSCAGSAHEIGFSNQDTRLLDRVEALMSSVFGMESSDTTNEAGTVTKRWISTKLYRWFESNFPEVMHTARDKRIPAAVLGASEEVIRRFLVGAFAGDGGVESEAMSYTTASEGLARDYADALSKIGVASRIHYSKTGDSWKTYVMGDSTERFVEKVVEPEDERHEKAREFVERSTETRRHHDVLPTSAAREIRSLRKLLGLWLTGKYRPHLDNQYGVQVETVQSELDELEGRVESIETALAETSDLAEIRSAVGWSGRTLADRLDGVTASTVHSAEDGGYDTTRRQELARRGEKAVREALDEARRRIEALQERTELRYYQVRNVETVANEGEFACDWVYDVTVEPTNTFVSQGVVLHNSISVSKAGINATLKSRCSLLGAANPTYGRFDQYESIGEQIELEPPLISRFDLIFTVTDQPDEEKDAELAEHIIQTNYAGELNTHREQLTSSNHTEEEVDRVTEEVAPEIEPEFLRKYIAYAKRNCFPTMTEEAKGEIQEFYVQLRSRGSDEDAPVPVTARKLEALVRLAEASARVRLSDTVGKEDAERATKIARYCLEEIGMDPETGEFDADVIETGTSKSQRDRIKNIKHLIATIEEEYDEGAPVDVIIERAEEQGIETSKAEHEIEKLKQKGEVYEPKTDHLRTT